MAKSKNVSINEDVLLAFLPKNDYNTLGFPTGSFNQLARQSPIIMATNDNATDPDDYPAEALLSDPHFRPMNFTQTEIDAVAATGN